MTVGPRVLRIAAVAGLLALSGCGATNSSSGVGAAGSAAGGGSGSGASGVRVSVVASTDVWGDVVRQVAGPLVGNKVQITSIITNPSADPHSYEADTQNLLALSKATLVVENGGGYDNFVDSMLTSAHNSSASVLDAVQISGRQPDAAGDLNEHVWYDFPTVHKVAVDIEQALSSADPADQPAFRSNLTAFDHQLTVMEGTEARIKKARGGDGVAITEPVPLYMLQACGLVNRTPSAFSEAVEEGTDVSPAVLEQTEELFSQGKVDLLAYNEQTAGAETEAVLDAAKAAGVAIVPVTETLPSGQDYLAWMKSNLAAIREALE